MALSSGGDLDSMVHNSKYTAITFLKDGCGACVPNLRLWDEIVKKNPVIKPVIIADAFGEKYFATLFDLHGVSYPYLFDTQETIQKLNDSIWIDSVVLVDSTYKIITKRLPFGSRMYKFFYTNLK